MSLSAEEIDEIQKDYEAELQSLTFNCKPMITHLTIIAQENLAAAEKIAQSIEKRILKAPVSYKLPALYLLDSIVKNVRTIYPTYFAKNLYTIFMAVFTVVDFNTRKKLEELFLTWKRPVPNSKSTDPVFPLASLNKIDIVLQKIHAAIRDQEKAEKLRNSQDSNKPKIDNNSSFKDNNDQTKDLRSTLFKDLNAKISNLRGMTRSYVNDNQLSSMIQLQNIVIDPSLSYYDLLKISDQINSNVMSNSQQQQQSVTSLSGGAQQMSSSVSSIPSLSYHSASSPTVQPSQISSLLTQLKSIGVINNNESTLDYLFANLEPKFLNNMNEMVLICFEGQQKLRCSICGKYFEKSDSGSKQRDEHLDSHFRINKRIRDNASQGQERSWFVDEEDFALASMTEDSASADKEDENQAEATPVETEQDSYVIVPNDPEMAKSTCAVCQEPFKLEYCDDIEEWIWPDTIAKNDAYYHTSCYKDSNKQLTNSSILGKRKQDVNYMYSERKKVFLN